MIKHIVLLKIRGDVDDATIRNVFETLGALKNSIPGVVSFDWGSYSSPEGLNKGFTHGFVMAFASVKHRDDYLVHPAHEAAKGPIIEILDDGINGVIAFDYEV